MTTAAPVASRTTRQRDEREPASRWPQFALTAICLFSAVLYAWGIGDSWGNPYYAAAVKSMSSSFENFFFGAFDPAGVLTVDKPPMALWVQTASVLVFGYNQMAVLLPQALAGVAAVFLLHRTVRRWAGERAALLAALVMALTPITVAINRDNNPDTLLVLLVVAAAYAVTRAIEDRTPRRRAIGWVVLAALLIGCGFLTKMLQAWMLLPVLLAVYLVGRNDTWARKLVDLAAAAGTVVVSSFWWVLATALWPAPKPYIGGSTNGSAWDLVVGYNGFGRILGGEGNGGGGGGGFSGTAGILRMFNEKLAGQISWLFPLCLLVLVAVGAAAVARWRRRTRPERTGTERHRAAGWTLWGGWFLLIALMFSTAQGTMHPYYTTMLAPAVGSITGAGLVRFWRQYGDRTGMSWLLFPTGMALTLAWALVLVLRNPNWNAWAGYLALGVGVFAIVALALGRRVKSLVKPGLVLGLAASLTVPAVWSATTAFGSTTGMAGVNPTAGPSTGGPGGSHGPGGPGGPGSPGGSGKQGGPGGPGGTQLTAEQRKVLDYATRSAGDRAIPLALSGGAMSSSSYIINTNLTVVGMGGFTGSDDAPTTAQLTEWKQSGKLGFVQLGGGPGGSHGPHHGKQPGGGGPGGRPGRGGPGGGAQSQARNQWVRQSCTPVAPAAYGENGDTDSSSYQQLYDCR